MIELKNGFHLHHGNCLETTTRMPNKSIDLIITDPPYGDSYKSCYQNYDNRGTIPVRIEREDYFQEIEGDEEVPTEYLIECYRLLKDASAIYIFCKWNKWHILFPAVEQAGFKIKNMIVMNKNNHGMGDLKGSYAPKHELVMFATKGKHILRYKMRPKDVIRAKVLYSGSRRLHPNQKPVEWIIPFILHSSDESDTILDLYMGSGTTGEACVNTARNFVGIEKEKKYFDIAVKRIRKAQMQPLLFQP